VPPALLDKPAAPAPAVPDHDPAADGSEPLARSTKRDGLENRVETWALTHLGPFWHACQRIGPIERVVNRALIDTACSKSPPRPYRLTTMAPYTSWSSLTDKSYNARQLPPVPAASRTLPPAEDVAGLFERGREMVPCPKSTVLFAYFAQWFTDGFLRSGRPANPSQPRDLARNEANPDVDLTQLYGLTPQMTDCLRAHRGGLLKSSRIGGEEFPPLLCDGGGTRRPEFAPLRVLKLDMATLEQRRTMFAMGSDAGNTQIGYAMISVLFLREHNRLASQLANAHPDWDDERLFQTARNILIVLLIKLTIEEYINHIAPYHFQFRFDPRGFDRSPWYKPNWIAVEFNLLYRWHSLIPDRLDVHGERLPIVATLFDNELLTRHGLGAAFADASGQRAGKVGLFNTARWFHAMTGLPSIVQSRELDLPSYNDYREDCAFPRATDFDQISSDPRVRGELRRLYGSVDAIEFYPGLFAEDARANSVLPSLLGRMVGVHAFSQLMTNPLLAPGIYGERTFSALGMQTIRTTNSLEQLLARNLPPGPCVARLTREGWTRE
jgi:prostaglandin-endoperoxide synthase 2